MTAATFQLSDVAELITKGTTPPKSMGGFSDVGVNYIKSESLSYSGAVDTSNLVKVSPEVHEKLKRSQLREGDILYSIAGANLGKCGIVPSEILPANTNQAVAIIRLDKTQADERFVSFFLRNPRFVRGVLAGVAQSAQPNVNLSDIGRYELPAFGLPEQKAIGDALGSLDDKIELNRRMNETLEEMARALFRDWFVDFGPTRRQAEGATDPAAIMGHAFPPEKATTLASLFPAKLGDDGLPEGWVRKPLSEFMSVKHGFAFKGEFFSKGVEQDVLVTPGNFKIGGGIKLHKLKYYSGPVDDNYVLEEGDFIVTMTDLSKQGDTLGYPAIVPLSTGKRFLHNQRIGKVSFESDELVWPYFYYFMRSQAYRDDILGSASGSTVKHTAPKKILATECIFHDEVVGAFSKIVAAIEAKTAANQQENQTLAEMRDLLLPKLMSGEIRLKDVEAAL